MIYNCNILIKEEFHNPGKSAKDRIAWYMMKEAIKRNKLPDGGIFVEASSGNTGISVSLIAKELGYKSKIFVSSSCSKEKIRILKSNNAEIQICDNSNGLHDFNSTQYLAQSFASNHPEAYFLNQYYNSNNIQAHYKTTGPEIWNQTEGKVTHVLIGLGTGGTISGIGRYLKEQNSNIKIWGVEPDNSVYYNFINNMPIEDIKRKFDSIEGIGRTFIPGSFDKYVVDKVFQIDSQSAKFQAHLFKRDFNFLLGYSSAALLAVLQKYKDKMNFNIEDQVVLLFPDYGDRYLSKLYNVNDLTQSFIK